MASQIVHRQGDRKVEWRASNPKRLSLYIDTDRGWRYIGNVTNFDWQAKAPTGHEDVIVFASNVVNEDQHWI